MKARVTVRVRVRVRVRVSFMVEGQCLGWGFRVRFVKVRVGAKVRVRF